MLHMPSPLLMQSGAKDYSTWLAHIATRTPNTKRYNESMGSSEGLFRIVNANVTSDTWGSVWRPSYSRGGAGQWAGGIRHGMPSATVFSQQIERTVLVSSRVIGLFSSLSGISRNGLTTASITQAENGGYAIEGIAFDELSYWDTTLDAPVTMIPSALSDNGPHPYSHPDWNS